MKEQNKTFIATDGYRLGGTVYDCKNAKAHIVMAGATGVPQWFYQKFARHAVVQGFSVTTFDYRGIGASKPDTLKGFDMQYLDWADKDLASVIDHVHRENVPLFVIGHSFGGHAIGLLPNHHKISGAYTFGTGAGWHGWMPGMEKLKVWLMWNILGPLMVKAHGFLAWDKLGMGENLPLGVYRDWKRWCSFPNYFFDDPEQPQMQDTFAKVNLPIVAVNAVDDKWAPPASRDAFMQKYRNAQLDLQTLDGRAKGFGAIGHMGYFRSKCSPLWGEVLNWCEAKI